MKVSNADESDVSPDTTRTQGDGRGNDEGEATSKLPLFPVPSQKRKATSVRVGLGQIGN